MNETNPIISSLAAITVFTIALLIYANSESGTMTKAVSGIFVFLTGAIVFGLLWSAGATIVSFIQ